VCKGPGEDQKEEGRSQREEKEEVTGMSKDALDASAHEFWPLQKTAGPSKGERGSISLWEQESRF
jgi:hypothetical protein